MKKKLTLTIDEKIKERAKLAAKKRGVSVSELVEGYLKKISSESDSWKPRDGSVVSKISGSVQQKDISKTYSDIVSEALIDKYGYDESSD